MTVWLWILGSVGAVSLLSLVGLATLSVKKSTLHRALFIMVGLAVGALPGDAFIHLIPRVFSSWMLPIAAGGFIDIAACDLVPQLHRETRPLQSLAQFLAIGIGAALMFGLLLFEENS